MKRKINLVLCFISFSKKLNTSWKLNTWSVTQNKGCWIANMYCQEFQKRYGIHAAREAALPSTRAVCTGWWLPRVSWWGSVTSATPFAPWCSLSSVAKAESNLIASGSLWLEASVLWHLSNISIDPLLISLAMAFQSLWLTSNHQLMSLFSLYLFFALLAT